MRRGYNDLLTLRKAACSYWSDRVTAQMMFLARNLQFDSSKLVEDALQDALRLTKEAFDQDGVITDEVCKKAEEKLQVASEYAKQYHVICAAHAHIDMNWQWSYDETVAITLDTFRTMLDFMDEYDDFTFSQSQASVYEIVQEYDPSMLERIRARVAQGRWEVTASTWVETDKNMTSLESLARHILYTKRYMASLFGKDAVECKLDFEPDTFGHNIQVPEILAKGGISYYYHCRGDASGVLLQNWTAPSGQSVLCHIEPDWYNSSLDSNMVLYMPEVWHRTGIHTLLRVYGVGNHGGGPTRRDIEKCIDMIKWPAFPSIRFGTMHEYFDLVLPHMDRLPKVDEEKNAIFTGCYTSQSRIKMANRISEDKLYDAEALATAAAVTRDLPYETDGFAKAWQNTLFNHFHDILPGSGIIDTREYAMGIFQKTMARVKAEQSKAMRALTETIDTGSYIEDDSDGNKSVSEGGGVGFGSNFGTHIYDHPDAERGKGIHRVIHLFNTLAFEREEMCAFVLWDWPGDVERMKIKDDNGQPIDFQIMDQGKTHQGGSTYWGHSYIKILSRARVPACGYITLFISQEEPESIQGPGPKSFADRTHEPDVCILENERLLVEFDEMDMSVKRFFDKQTGQNLIDQERPGCILRLITEDTDRGMTSWIVGRTKNEKDFRGHVSNVKWDARGNCNRSKVSYTIQQEGMKALVTVALDRDSTRLDYTIDCEWLKVGTPQKGIPQLQFYVPVAYETGAYRYGQTFGSIDRDAHVDNRPGIGYVQALSKHPRKNLVVHAKTKHGFLCDNHAIAVNLIRSSYDPDPHPELCNHHIELAVQAVSSDQSIDRESLAYRHPILYQSGKIQKGTAPARGSFMCMEQNRLGVSCVKMSEDGQAMVVRVYNDTAHTVQDRLLFDKKIKSAAICDINERVVDANAPIAEASSVSLVVRPYSVETVLIEF